MECAIPKSMRNAPIRTTHHSCRWCGARKMRKHLYKLRDGPIDWWFCDDEHALEWLENRHKNPVINAMLRLNPIDRNLDGKTIDEWLRDELSQGNSRDALSKACDASHGVCDLANMEVSVHAHTELSQK